MGVGVNMQLMMSKPASILEDLSRHCIDPHIVAESVIASLTNLDKMNCRYVGKWSNKLEDFNHSMLTYAMHLIMKASSSADVGARHLALLSADGALRLLKVKLLLNNLFVSFSLTFFSIMEKLFFTKSTH